MLQSYLMQQNQITINSKVIASKEQISCDLNDETVILSLPQGAYYGLNPVGANIWDLIKKPILVSDLLNVLLQEYETNEQECKRDLIKLLEDLKTNSLIEIVN